MDLVSRTERVEAELDTMIERRDLQRRKTEGERGAEEMYDESVRRYHERARKENRARWYAFHADMSELHTRLAAEHEARAQKLLEGDDAA